MEKNGTELGLPGFRFHPTEEELLDFYLRKMVHGIRLNFDIIGTINLYQHDPWELPGLAKIGEREWYFFVPRDRKQANRGRPNRTTERGFWKATGSDRPIRSADDPKRLIGLKKTLVYYKGRAPRGAKTDWVMNEYRLPDDASSSSSSSSAGPPPLKEDIVICKVYRKATTLKELEQRAAIEEENTRGSQCIASILSGIPSENFQDLQDWAPIAGEDIPNEHTKSTIEDAYTEGDSSSSALSGSVGLQDIEVLEYNNTEWSHDSFLNQLRRPWVDLWSLYADILNL